MANIEGYGGLGGYATVKKRKPASGLGASLRGFGPREATDVANPRVVSPTVPKFTPPIVVGQQPQQDTSPGFAFGTETYNPSDAITAALAARSRKEAQAQADAKLKQAAIQYGEGPEGEKNPFSVLHVLDRNYKTGVGDLEEDLNKANLFYSGYRGKQLGEAANQYQQQKYEAGTRYQGLVSDIKTALAQALLNADIMAAQAGGGGGGGGAPSYGTGEAAGLLVNEPATSHSDVRYATPGNGLPAGSPGWQRLPNGGWRAPNGMTLDENGRRD